MQKSKTKIQRQNQKLVKNLPPIWQMINISVYNMIEYYTTVVFMNKSPH